MSPIPHKGINKKQGHLFPIKTPQKHPIDKETKWEATGAEKRVAERWGREMGQRIKGRSNVERGCRGRETEDEETGCGKLVAE